ncbi:MAG: UDP-N-acetylglucosamine 1-carboxyvinyltransferase [Desulfobacteraceae bacterium]|jgi:UDP-N-acetylglucosamine 1-carboxyvinyltransferase|nr:MAG: UDP-N-acetylglucosamine 1-carboxyvinyltransferase [Desulfobacteraceae bacterium]
MDDIIITGGKPLAGEAVISGAKNAALPILAATLLTGGRFQFDNVPMLRDITSIQNLLGLMGADIQREGHTMFVDTGNLCQYEAPYEEVRKMRASILVLGPLLARMKRARVSLPGGCAIGARPIDLHLKGMAALGADITLEHGYVEASAERLKGAEIYFDIPTVTGTENIMMAAALAEGVTILRNAAREPEITALADILNRMGADIEGAGTPMITIHGVRELKPVSAPIIPDRIEAGTFMVAAALTHGDIHITRCEPSHLKSLMHKLEQAGAKIDVSGTSVRVRGGETILSQDVKTMPYPGFPTDMQAQFMVLMSVARGFSVISESIFENRFIHVSELKRMGADINISGSHAMIKGVPSLSGAPVMASDLRASACLVLAGLAAGGVTRISRIYHLDRGYESLEKKFAALGADIARVRAQNP